ncbi:MAG: aminomethyl-transferring glycine dehydrogenase subunit GcvPB [Elusimicrobia bacterium]|nr:aminomethyl-transferring glycine dehydrogenase subunit GcvPB [Elusimicrobiota bacterium]
MNNETIFEKSKKGRRAIRFNKPDVPTDVAIPKKLCRKNDANLSEVSELDCVRHFTDASRNNFGVDTNFYPLGSCTMKYNPKLGEEVASYRGFSDIHPLLPQLRRGGLLTQGALQVIYETERLLSEITGMAEFTMQPFAGAHGELTGIMIIAAYHKSKGNKKTKIIVPNSSHGTNPASAAIGGYKIVSIPTNEQGTIDFTEFEKQLDNEVAGVMMTCPNTLGIFETDIKKVADKVHEIDGLMYYDGANLNAILGKCRSGDVGFDIVHINLHKTFATPHGGGGPGAGPVGVVEKLKKFLPISAVVKRSDSTFSLEYDKPSSIGYIAPFYGNFGVILKAYSYILTLGKEGLIRVSENAVLNANYIKEKLKKYYHLPYDKPCMHECVFSAKKQAEKGVSAVDIAKSLIDRGFHPPTIYFPLNVKEAIMIEPTETESKETIDAFIEAMIEIAKLAEENPKELHDAPQKTPVGRLDEVKAVKELKLCI